MKKIKRRKFLLFMGSAGIASMTGCLETCLPFAQQTYSYETPPYAPVPYESNINMEKLQNEIKGLIADGKKITLKWNCGGDEAIVTTSIDGKEIDYRENILADLDLYIVNFLNLPDAGEFAMEGKGEILLEGENIYLDCQTAWLGYEDYNEDYSSSEWKTVYEIDEEYSGKRQLFKDD